MQERERESIGFDDGRRAGHCPGSVSRQGRSENIVWYRPSVIRCASPPRCCTPSGTEYSRILMFGGQCHSSPPVEISICDLVGTSQRSTSGTWFWAVFQTRCAGKLRMRSTPLWLQAHEHVFTGKKDTSISDVIKRMRNGQFATFGKVRPQVHACTPCTFSNLHVPRAATDLKAALTSF